MTSHHLLRRLFIACIAAAAAVCLAPALFADDGDASGENLMAELLRRVTKLEAENADLKARVESLESKSTAPGGGPTPASPAAGTPVMEFFSLTTLTPDPTLSTQAQQLRGDAAQLQQQAVSLESQWGQLADQSQSGSGGGRLDGGNGSGGNVDSTAGQRIALRRQIDMLHDQASRKRADASRLEGQVANPPQILKGWDGTRVVILTIDTNFADLASSLSPGDFVTWRGSRTKLTDTVDQYDRVFVLKKAARPSNFQEPPGGQLPS